MTNPTMKLITTEDGSHSLFREDIQETYHSSHGARSESQYVFIKMGLEDIVSLLAPKSIKVFEVGLGTGLNVLLSAQFAEANGIAMDFHSVEPIPVPKEIYQQLNYGRDACENELLLKIHDCPWHSSQHISDSFALTKYKTTLESFNGANDFDIIFFDAFAPSKQPEVWSIENIKKCAEILKSGGILTTYCAQGQFKRNLKEAGFEIEILPGALGKKEMVRARKK
jgi:tRNA U34 5-methylaminomethyl-2-thiouridine-forming methyltransferase MnmC